MPSRIYTIERTDPISKRTTLVERKHQVWYHSPRVNGRLRLRANPSTRQNARLVTRRTYGNKTAADAIVPGTPGRSSFTGEIIAAQNRLKSESYARLRGRLYKGSAALGVTIGSYKQSRDMIVTRYRQMSLQLDRKERDALRVFRMRKGRRQTLALDKLGGQYLEMVFGWQPLLADVHAAARTVVNLRPQTFWVRGTAESFADWKKERYKPTAYRRQTVMASGTLRVSRCMRVEVSNPNTWLRERAGLNNPAAVAWDLVPWSFVVNMFANTGQLVNSITDFAGLTFSDGSLVVADDLITSEVAMQASPTGSYGGYVAHQESHKQVSLDAVERPPLVFRVPEANWELAAIAASLFFQKFSRVSRLVNFHLK